MATRPPSSTPAEAAAGPVLRVEGLRAYYQMKLFGIEREVRAVDDISLEVRSNEIYGIAGESSCGKTSFIKTLAAAIRPAAQRRRRHDPLQLPRSRHL